MQPRLTFATLALCTMATLACSDDSPSSSEGVGASEGGTAVSTGDPSPTQPSSGTDPMATGGEVSTTAEPPVATGLDTSSGSGRGGSTDTSGSGSGSSSTGVEVCEAPGALIDCDAITDAADPFAAIGLGCEGSANEVIPLQSASFHSLDPDAWRTATQYGTFLEPGGDPLWRPTRGDQMLMISSGWIAPADEAGVVTMAALHQDDNDNPDDKPLPAPMSPLLGSGGTPFMGCDGVNDCSDSLLNQWTSGGAAALDLLWFQATLEVPGGTHGFRVDFAFFSEEFPEFVGSQYNDMFVVWSSSESYVGNLCFVNNQPCTVTALWPVDYEQFAPELAGTGFEIIDFDEGGGTGWYQIKGSAEPHETLQLTFALFDMGDDILDTLVLLDGFSWDCEGCSPTPENPCGVVEPGS